MKILIMFPNGMMVQSTQMKRLTDTQVTEFLVIKIKDLAFPTLAF